MKRSLLLIPALLFFSLNAMSEDKMAKMDSKMDPKHQEMMKKMEVAGTPGEQHKMLADVAGKWKTSSQMWESPKSEPQTSKGNATFKSVLGGRWLQQEFTGDMMGQKYEGIGMFGYDNVKQKFESHWFDSMSTGSMNSTGMFEASTKTIKDKATMSCPISKSKTQDIRTDWQMVDKNKMIYSMYGKGPDAKGPEFKMMEITYTR